MSPPKISPAAQELLEGQKDTLEVLGKLLENAEEITFMLDWWTSVMQNWVEGEDHDVKGFTEAMRARLPEILGED